MQWGKTAAQYNTLLGSLKVQGVESRVEVGTRINQLLEAFDRDEATAHDDEATNDHNQDTSAQ